jgi:conjugal transfer pilus assembly protein TraU
LAVSVSLAALAAIAGTPLACAGSPTAPGLSNVLCPDAGIFNELVGGVCWSDMFPIRIGGATMVAGGPGAPPGASNQLTCTCGGNWRAGQLPTFGFPVGFWQPSMLIEATAAPFCMPALGGVRMGSAGLSSLFSGALGGNTTTSPNPGGSQQTFYNVHIYTFPLVAMMNLLNIPSCGTGYNGWNLVGLSETEPQWNDDLTAALIWPEAAVLSGPIGYLGAVGECLAELPGGAPIQSMYWTAGCWGTLLPASGSLANGADPITDSSIVATRFLATQYRLGFGYKTVGDATLCGPQTTIALPKDQFRMQILYPNDETNNTVNPGVAGPYAQPGLGATDLSPTQLSPQQSAAPSSAVQSTGSCTHWIGDDALKWGEWDGQPGTGGNFVYLLWQWTDCCMGVLGGTV